MVGKSGIGKSETALDLVVRGHRLVADDVIRDPPPGQHRASGAGARDPRPPHGDPRPRDHQHQGPVRHLGGARDQEDRAGRRARTSGTPTTSTTGSGSTSTSRRLLDVAVPKLRVPVRPGRNLATLIEVAARNQLLKLQGIHSARAFRDQATSRDAARQPTRRGRGGVDADRHRHRAVGRGQEHRAACARGHRVHCVDNIPVPLVAQMVDHLAHEGDRDKLAIAIDARQRRNLAAWAPTLSRSCAAPGTGSR